MPMAPEAAFVTREVSQVVCWSLVNRAVLMKVLAVSGSSTVAVSLTVMLVPGGRE